MMKERKNPRSNRVPLFIVALIASLIACNPAFWPQGQAEETPSPAPGDALADDVELGAPSEDRKPLSCPKEKTLFYLWYDHTFVMDPSPEAHFEEISEPPGALNFYIDASGEVSTEGIVNEVTLTTTGWIKSPDSDKCPITNYEGSYPLRVEISGSCRNGNIHLRAKGERIDYNLYADCPSAHLAPGLGPTSAPEMEHTFQIVEGGDVYKLESPPSPFMDFTYMWVLEQGRPGELPIQPLVPTIDVGD